jgi:hypothetical protein
MNLFLQVVAFCDGVTRESLGFPVHRCIQLRVPPARLNLHSAFFERVKRSLGYKYCFHPRREYERTFYDETNQIVVTMQPAWYCFNSRRHITQLEFSMKVVADVHREELIAPKRKKRCNECAKATRLQFNSAGKVVRGVNYQYKLGRTLYENVLPEVNKIDFCVVE